MKQIELCGVKIHDLTMEEAVAFALIPRPQPCFAVTPNALMLDACRRDAAYRSLLNRATLSLPDGAGVLRAAKKKGTPLQKRIAGIDFGEAILGKAAELGLNVFLLGGEDGVAKKATESLCLRYPSLRITGTHGGYFQKTGEENQRVLARIEKSRAEILFVCFGFPRQELWIDENLPRLKFLRLAAGLGGSLDVWSGNLRRAPAFFIDHGLEWAWRMAREPKRLKNLPALMRFHRYKEK